VVVNAGVKEEWEMKHRRRKRIKGLILALATAAIVVPAASGHVYEGGSTGYVNVEKTSSARPDYSGLTPAALKAMDERWTKMAEAYQQQVRPDDRAGVRGVGQASAPDYIERKLIALERQVSQAVHADDRAGIRGPGPIETPTLVTSHGDGFDWTDAGIGASAAVFMSALLAAAAMSRRRTSLAT
jgi:hypothetical protein